MLVTRVQRSYWDSDFFLWEVTLLVPPLGQYLFQWKITACILHWLVTTTHPSVYPSRLRWAHKIVTNRIHNFSTTSVQILDVYRYWTPTDTGRVQMLDTYRYWTYRQTDTEHVHITGRVQILDTYRHWKPTDTRRLRILGHVQVLEAYRYWMQTNIELMLDSYRYWTRTNTRRLQILDAWRY